MCEYRVVESADSGETDGASSSLEVFIMLVFLAKIHREPIQQVY